MTLEYLWVLVAILVLVGALLTSLVIYVYRTPEGIKNNEDAHNAVKDSRERLLSLGENE